MANVTYNDHTTDTSPTNSDLIPFWDVVAGVAKKTTRANLVGATLTDGGTIVTGGYTLTVPATGTAALRDKANTFTQPQTISAGAYPVLNLTRGGGNPAIEFSDGTTPVAITYRGGICIGPNIDWAPIANDTYDLGTNTYKWDDVYATNGTIQTSDEREKRDVADSALGLDFVAALRAVQFRWARGKRPHQGLLAQQVKAVMDAQGIEDFAGYIHDAESDTYGIRYAEFIPPLIRAVQELTARVAALEAALSKTPIQKSSRQADRRGDTDGHSAANRAVVTAEGDAGAAPAGVVRTAKGSGRPNPAHGRGDPSLSGNGARGS